MRVCDSTRRYQAVGGTHMGRKRAMLAAAAGLLLWAGWPVQAVPLLPGTSYFKPSTLPVIAQPDYMAALPDCFLPENLAGGGNAEPLHLGTATQCEAFSFSPMLSCLDASWSLMFFATDGLPFGASDVGLIDPGVASYPDVEAPLGMPPVPEPGGLALLAAGLTAVLRRRRA